MFFQKPIDFLAIGDIVTDAFIRLKEAHVHCRVDSTECEISMKFGDKIPFESATEVRGVGNSANASVAAARLGLRAALIANVGDDSHGEGCIEELEAQDVDTRYMQEHAGIPTNYHYVLWYGDERTILVKHQEFPYSLPRISKEPRWIYLSSLGSNSLEFHDTLADYLETHPQIQLAFQPGTFQMKAGHERLSRIYKRSQVFVCNVEEAQRILGSSETDKKALLRGLFGLGPRIVLVSDGPHGAYAYDGEKTYFMPIYPDIAPPVERTGAGDAFASTFVSALILGLSLKDALRYAPINSMNVVQHIGAQAGLLTRSELEAYLAKAPEFYHAQEI